MTQQHEASDVLLELSEILSAKAKELQTIAEKKQNPAKFPRKERSWKDGSYTML